MKGLSTEEIMGIALELVGWKEIPLDSGIHIPGENIKRLIFTMDANVGLLHMAKGLGFDAVVAHHPCGVLPRRGEVYRRHIDLLVEHGISREKTTRSLLESIEKAVRRIENNPLAVLVVGNPLAGREDFVNRHQDSLGWCRPIHPGPSGSLLVQSGSMMRPTSASAPAHRMRPRSRY